MNKKNCNSFNTLSHLEISGEQYQYHSLSHLFKAIHKAPEQFPYSLKVLIENLLRNEDGILVKKQDIQNILTKFGHYRHSQKCTRALPNLLQQTDNIA